MGSTRFFHGAGVLSGDNTVPGVKLPDELEALLPRIFKSVADYGCEYYDTVVQMLTYDEISEVAAYGGFPVRYPHWRFGMEYEELQRGYEHGMHRIYEMVINTNPCYIYCLNSNTLVDNVCVVAHALGHNDFFKNNIFFKPTSQNMMNQLANHGSRIRRYMQRWGKEKVQRFMDHVLRIDTLIDFSKAWQEKKIKDVIIADSRQYNHPARLGVKEDHDYMEDYINPRDWKAQQQEKVDRQDAAQEIGLFGQPEKDIMGFLKDHAPLKPWQQDILAMLYEESMYFAPQRMTKVANEGWASFIDFKMMCELGLVSLGQETEDSGIVEYAAHKMGVLGGKYSMNPYKLGFYLLRDIEERWNKGRFGPEWDAETDMAKREAWDLKLNKGHEKVFEVRKYYDDLMLISEFFTDEFCHKHEFYEWKRYPNGEYRIENRDPKTIRRKLMARHLNGGLPEIKLTEPNFRGKGIMMLQHLPDDIGRTLYENYIIPVLQSLYTIWGNDVCLATYDKEGQEIVYFATGDGEGDIHKMARKDFEKQA